MYYRSNFEIEFLKFHLFGAPLLISWDGLTVDADRLMLTVSIFDHLLFESNKLGDPGYAFFLVWTDLITLGLVITKIHHMFFKRVTQCRKCLLLRPAIFLRETVAFGGDWIPLDSHEIMFYKTFPYRHPVPPMACGSVFSWTLKTYQSNIKLTSGGIRLDV